MILGHPDNLLLGCLFCPYGFTAFLQMRVLRYYAKFDRIEERGYRNYEIKHKTNHQNWFCILVDLRVLADVQQCDTADPDEHISHE